MTVLSEFVAFVGSQPEDRIIDHYRGWSHCAVGEFAASTERRGMDVADDLAAEEATLLQLEDCYESPNSLMRMLNNASAAPRTYGELNKVITEQYDHIS